ncbi:MAG TPA: MBL fold metallo-hydrolase [Arenimonas sp.]|nr:MBL fold metallo-hydrolase [Arenimonas sp.]
MKYKFLTTFLTTLLLLSIYSQVCSAENKSPYLYILGVAQDAGYPQIGCYAPHCLPGWENPALRRSATSLALIDPQAKKKYLFEATPNLPEQLYRLEMEAPSSQYPLSGIFLTHAHIGHYTGLMHLGHEAMGTTNMPVYAMPRMLEFLKINGPWSQLVNFKNILLMPLQNEHAEVIDSLKITPFLVPHRDEYSETVGYRISGPSKSALFIPDINKWSEWKTNLADIIQTVDYALIDATFYADGELPGRDMSKIPHPYVIESMKALQHLPVEQRNKIWFMHMNHSNPLLNTNSKESIFVRENGFHIAIEGIRLPL